MINTMADQVRTFKLTGSAAEEFAGKTPKKRATRKKQDGGTILRGVSENAMEVKGVDNAGIANAAISNSTKGRNKGAAVRRRRRRIQTPQFMSDGSTYDRPLVRRSRRSACRDPVISEH
jgi:hypothetical protein